MNEWKKGRRKMRRLKLIWTQSRAQAMREREMEDGALKARAGLRVITNS